MSSTSNIPRTPRTVVLPTDTGSPDRVARHLDVTSRRTPHLGALNLTLLGLEIRRRLRNRRAMIFSLAMPVVFLIMFTTSQDGTQAYGSGNVASYLTIGMALFGALMTTTGAGAAVSTERASGWSRQLRLTPLRPVCYVLTKAAVGMLVSMVVIAGVYAVGALRHARMPAGAWAASALIVWVGSLVFVAFGLFVGYVLSSDNAMQVVGGLMALLAFLGGMFVPPDPGLAPGPRRQPHPRVRAAQAGPVAPGGGGLLLVVGGQRRRLAGRLPGRGRVAHEP